MDRYLVLRGNIVLIGSATLGGLAGWVSGLPAGALLGSMLASVAAQRCLGGQANLWTWFTLAARLLIGVGAGALVTMEVVAGLGSTILWALVALFALITTTLAVGAFAARHLGVGLESGLVASAPGGIVELSALAEDLSLSMEVVFAIHVVRRFMVVGVVMVIALVWLA